MGAADVAQVQAVLYDLQRVSERVEITGNVRAVADDPDDDKFVECALIAGASSVVSGDHHLLELGEYAGIPILSAAEFIARFV
ncbi:MAG: putative toxin-antitoxin system toxin component, PIN family [Anaerolineae bacterium]